MRAPPDTSCARTTREAKHGGKRLDLAREDEHAQNSGSSSEVKGDDAPPPALLRRIGKDGLNSSLSTAQNQLDRP